MFSDTEKEFQQIKHLTEKTTVFTGIVDSCPGCGRPHTAHPIAKISKVKDLASYLAYHVFIFCQKAS